MNQARLSTESIIRVVGHYGNMLEGTENTAIIYLNSMAAPMLQNLQRDLQTLQRQLAIYAGGEPRFGVGVPHNPGQRSPGNNGR